MESRLGVEQQSGQTGEDHAGLDRPESAHPMPGLLGPGGELEERGRADLCQGKRREGGQRNARRQAPGKQHRGGRGTDERRRPPQRERHAQQAGQRRRFARAVAQQESPQPQTGDWREKTAHRLGRDEQAVAVHPQEAGEQDDHRRLRCGAQHQPAEQPAARAQVGTGAPGQPTGQ
ncbi:MAG: hypothetical protein QJR02_12355 [Sinobacteraceae bacterium]|nr:hypothetical protein [Nevskiaceae bacterium]